MAMNKVIFLLILLKKWIVATHQKTLCMVVLMYTLDLCFRARIREEDPPLNEQDYLQLRFAQVRIICSLDTAHIL